MFKQLTDELFVAPQLSLEDINEAIAAGFKTFICNRPDAESPDQPAEAELRKRIEEQGGRFVSIPVSGGNFTLEAVSEYKATVASAEKPCLAYCRSGTRSTVLWALGQVNEMSVEDILETAENAGYDLSHMLERLR